MSEWKEYRVEDLVARNILVIGDGYRAKNSELDATSANGLPFARVKNINGGFDFSDADFFPRDRLDAVGLKVSQVGDTVFTSKGTVGRFAFVNETVSQFIYSPQLCFWRVLDHKFIDPLFQFYWMQSKEFLEQVEAVKSQTDMADYVNLTDQRQMKITIPELPEQKAITAVLSSLDDKIDLLHRQNKTLEALAQTLFRHWFIDDAAVDWEDGTLGEVINIYDSQRIPLSKMERDKMKEGKLYPYYGAASIMDYVNQYIFDGEYILMGEDGTVRTDEGYPILQYATGKFWVNNHAHVFQAKKPYSNFFVWCYLQKKNINEIVTGAVQPKINQGNLKSLDFPIAPVELVTRFNDTVMPLFDKIKANNRQFQTLEKLRDTLLPKLMSGEVRVRQQN